MHSMQVRVDKSGHLDVAPSAPGKLQVTPSTEGATLMWKPATDDRKVRFVGGEFAA